MALSVLIIISLVLFSPSLQNILTPEALNKAVDDVIDTAKRQLFDVAKLPDTYRTLLLADITLQDGYLIGLNKLSRVGHVGASTSKNGSVNTEVALQFNNMYVAYLNYTIKLVSRGVNQGRAVTSKDNVTFNVFFTFGNTICDIELKDVAFKKYYEFKVKLVADSGLDASLTDFIYNDVFNIFNSMIKDKVEENMKTQIKSATEKYKKDCKAKNL